MLGSEAPSWNRIHAGSEDLAARHLGMPQTQLQHKQNETLDKIRKIKGRYEEDIREISGRYEEDMREI